MVWSYFGQREAKAALYSGKAVTIQSTSLCMAASVWRETSPAPIAASRGCARARSRQGLITSATSA